MQKFMLHRHTSLVLIVFIALLLAMPIGARATIYNYTYTGNPLTGTMYDGADIPYTDGNPRHFSISFQYGELQAYHAYNTTYFPGTGVPTGYTTLDFQMSNGVNTYSSIDSQASQFVIESLDGNGLPSSWWIVLQGPLASPLIDGSAWEQFYSTADSSYQGEMSFLYTYHSTGNWLTGGPYSARTAVATNQHSPGVWSRTAVESVPEPATGMLLLCGILGLGALRRKSK